MRDVREPVGNWYALQVRSHAEAIVESFLNSREVESFYPSYERKAASSNHRARVLRLPFFPGYVFGKFDINDRRPILEIPQIVRIVGIGTMPVEIAETEIESVRAVAARESLVGARTSEFFTEGRQVVVADGPLRGVRGRVDYTKNPTRIVVSIRMLCRAISAEVDASSLRILEPKQ